MDHEALKKKYQEIDDGAYWNLLQEKQALRVLGSLTNISGAKTVLVPDKATVESMKDLDKSAVIEMAYRFIIHRYIENLSDFDTKEFIGGNKSIKTSFDSSKNVVSVVKSKAQIVDIGVKPDDTKPYLRIFGVTGLIEDGATESIEYTKIQGGGALTQDAMNEDSRMRVTRIRKSASVRKTLAKNGMNYSYLMELSAHVFAALADFNFRISPHLILPCPVTFLACLLVRSLPPESIERSFYTAISLVTSFVESPYDVFAEMFTGENKTSMNEVERFNNIKQIKDRMPKKDKYSYNDLYDVVIKLFPENSDARKLIIINYCCFLEYQMVINSDRNTTSKFATKTFDEIMAKMHLYFNKDKPGYIDIKNHTFSAEFVNSPFFLFTATNIKKLDNTDPYTVAYKNVLETMSSVADGCRLSPGAYVLNKDVVEILRNRAFLTNRAPIDEKPRGNTYRRKTFLIKDPHGIGVKYLYYHIQPPLSN